MSVRSFFDTNILAYAFTWDFPEKRQRASQLVERGLNAGTGIISFQVAQEFLSLSQRKFTPPLAIGEAQVFLREVLTPLCHVFPSMALLGSALEIKDRYKFHFYDSLIVAAALEAGCERLYSEDLQHGQQIAQLRIENPFVT
jgi:predicted nucleic acid-binding protein